MLKCFLFSYDDIAKDTLAWCIKQLITYRTFGTVGHYTFTSDHVVTYGSTVVWTSVFEGIAKVPHRLFTYALAQKCFDVLLKGARMLSLDYPQCVKSNYYLYWSAYLLVPFLSQRALRLGCEALIDSLLYGKEDETDFNFSVCDDLST